MVDRLGEILVGPGLEPGDDVFRVGHRRHQNDRDERRTLLFLERAADLDTVDLRHHDVEQDQIGLRLMGHRQSLFAVSGGDDLIAIGRQAGPHDPKVGGVVVSDQDARRSLHPAS